MPMFSFEEDEWPVEPEEEPEEEERQAARCECNQALAMAGTAEWCAFCQQEYEQWLDRIELQLELTDGIVFGPADVLRLQNVAKNYERKVA